MIKYEFEPLLEYLKQTYGCDLNVYKRLTVDRQLHRRMNVLRLKTSEDYLDYLKTYPKELSFLRWSVISIKYTKFFRDRIAWDYLANQIVSQILANKQPDEPIRVWSAGCAYGQEVYTLAIVLAEVLGIEQYLQRVRIYATDIDEQAVAIARKASYSISDVLSVPADLLAKYFKRVEDRYIFDSKLSRQVVFCRHNLTEDPPIHKVDLLVCRNVMIYLKLQTQAELLRRFWFALNPNGFLFLGKVETLTSYKNIFTPVSLKHGIFTKVKVSLKDQMLLAPHHFPEAIDTCTSQTIEWQKAFETSTVAQIALNPNRRAIAISRQAYSLLGLESNTLSRSFYQLKLDRIVGLRTAIEQASHARSTVLKKVEWSTPNSTIYLDIQIAPILGASNNLLAISLAFTDVTGDWHLEQLEHVDPKSSKISAQLDVELDSFYYDLNNFYLE